MGRRSLDQVVLLLSRFFSEIAAARLKRYGDKHSCDSLLTQCVFETSLRTAFTSEQVTDVWTVDTGSAKMGPECHAGCYSWGKALTPRCVSQTVRSTRPAPVGGLRGVLTLFH